MTVTSIVRVLQLRAAEWFVDRCAGVCLAFGSAYLALVLSNWSGLPAMILALALGLLLRMALPEPRLEAGYGFVAGSVLRLGIILLGARLTANDIAVIGWGGFLVPSAVVLTVFSAGLLLGRHPRIGREHGLVAGGAVAICGASAAAAMAAILPPTPRREQATLGAVAGVSLAGALLMLAF
ncbi:MAG: putative sulfate exporter family transporter, partial [Ferrovibrio sp.]|uniref:putative sulfate exporter family transporter n=1 Tax=Ferrovibrio sp. TaxID=1917215 RepID=UPI00262A0162